MYISETECTFVFSSVVKHSRPGYHQQPLILRSFPSNPSLCPVTNITQYLKFRLEKSANEGFFMITVPPYKQCLKDTIARWIKETLSLAGISSGIYQAHSIWSASASLVLYKGVNLSTILIGQGTQPLKNIIKRKQINYFVIFVVKMGLQTLCYLVFSDNSLLSYLHIV